MPALWQAILECAEAPLRAAARLRRVRREVLGPELRESAPDLGRLVAQGWVGWSPKEKPIGSVRSRATKTGLNPVLPTSIEGPGLTAGRALGLFRRMDPPRPFMDGPWRLAMGLRALEPADWLDRSPDALAQIPRRRELLAARRDDVVGASAGSLPAQAEATDRILRHLLSRHPDQLEDADGAIVERPGGARFEPRDHEECPLALAGALVAEDLCLMEARDDGYRLTAGVLCFPLHWSLRDKLDRPLGTIHAPVPGFGERLGRPAERFFESLNPTRPVWRVNWSLVDTPEPFLPPSHRGSATAFDPARPAETLWFRTERQTLRRLPRTGAVLFTIRTRIEPLGRVLETPGAAPALAARLREMPEPMARYKGILPIRAALLAYLDGHSSGAGGSIPSGLTATG